MSGPLEDRPPQHRPSEDRPPAAGPLGGLRLVNLSTSLAGAHVAQLFADFGAEVIMVEPPGGSPLRDQAAFPFWARGTHSVEVDLDGADDLQVVRSLCTRADVVVETFAPGRAAALGLDDAALRPHHPGLVLATISGFGPDGPYAGVPGWEGIVLARLGALHVLGGLADRAGPGFSPVPFASFSAAQTALHAILAALYERRRSGLGQHVEANLAQAVLAHDPWNWFLRLLSRRYSGAFTGGPPVSDAGIPNTSFAFRLAVGLSADGRWLQFSQVTPRLFEAFLRALDLQWMLDDPKWRSAPEFEDVEQRVEFWERMLAGIRARTAVEWQEVFDDDPDVWAEIFRAGSELLHHPQMVHDRRIVTLEDPSVGPVLQPAALVACSATPAILGVPAPALDQHGAEVRRLARPAVSVGDRASVPAGDGASVPVGDGASVPAGDPAMAVRGGLPLAGVTILELSSFYAGPYGATVLTDLGARVIKVEGLEGEPLRSLLPVPDGAALKVLQGKESVVVDLSTDEGREIVYALARRADAVLQSFRAGVARRLAIDADTMLAVNPDLVYLNAPGYGVDGPCGHRPAFAPTMGAGSGLARRTAGPVVEERADLTLPEVKRYAMRLGTAAQSVVNADGFASLAVGTALLLGLVARQGGAPGQVLDTSMLSTMAHTLSEEMVEYAGARPAPTADGELYGLGARYRLYEAGDGWVFLAAPRERDWAGLVDGLAPWTDLAGDGRFATEADRRGNDGALAEVLGRTFLTRAAGQWEAEMLAAGVALVEVRSDGPDGLFLDEEELCRASGYLVDVEHPTYGTIGRLAPLVRFSRSATVAGRACLMGEHSDAVLAELGYDADRIAALRSGGVVA